MHRRSSRPNSLHWKTRALVDWAAGRSFAWVADEIATAGGVVPFFVSMPVACPLAEEPGWSGTAYPRLRASMSRLQAGLLLGAVWAVWHLPLFFITGTVQAAFGLVQLVVAAALIASQHDRQEDRTVHTMARQCG